MMALSNIFSVFVISSSIVELQSTPARLLSFEPQMVMCPMDIQECADGTYVSRDPKLKCQFPPCDIPMMCTADVRRCPDGSYVSRDAKNGCAFPPCPDILACTEDAKQCPDGSWVSRDAANNCEFSPCPDIIAPIEEVGCGIDNCNSYFDGCNQCGCGKGGAPFCTLMYCHNDWMKKPYCTGCEPGYILNKATNKCEGCVCTADYNPVCCNGKTYSNQCRASCEQATECVRGECGAVDKPCGGFDNCVAYYDGCNNCSCGPNGLAACTRKMCFRKDTPKCIQCAKGYRLSGGVCVADLLLY